jgi:hypothetical protein
MRRSKWYVVLWETVLLLGSIPLFRGVWMLCDSIELLNQRVGILLSLAGGIVLCVVALLALNNNAKEQGLDSCHHKTS